MPTVYYPKPIHELLHSLASGGLPHKSVAGCTKMKKGFCLGFFVNAKHKEVTNFEGGLLISSVPASTIWGSHSK